MPNLVEAEFAAGERAKMLSFAAALFGREVLFGSTPAMDARL
jgi:hypothetical protein